MTHKSYKDIKPELDEARNEYGADQKKKGLVEGKDIGKQDEKIEIAKNLLNMNMDIETIMKATGLSKKEIKKIENEMK